MKRISVILFFCCSVMGCGVRINSTYIKPGGQSDVRLPHEYPVILEFRKNGRCVETSKHPGSDSGPVKYQILGNYSISNDSIIVKYIWSRGASGRFNIEDVDWQDIEDSFTTIYHLNQAKDTLTVLEADGKGRVKFILESE